MARLGSKPVRPGRATVAASVGAIGLFVVSMAAGLGSDAGGWPFGAVGAALVIISVALLTTSSMRGSDRALVAAAVHVVEVTAPPLSTTDYGRCEMQVLVDSPHHPGQTVVIREPRVPVAKWPRVGDTLPALVSVSDARRVKIQWDRVGFYRDRYEDEAGIIGDPRDYYLADEDDYREPEPSGMAGEWGIPAPVDPLPRRKPSPYQTESRPVAVLEGELIPAEVPAPREGSDEDAAEPGERIDLLSFSEIPEPAEPTPPSTGPVLISEPVMPTQPHARPASAGSIQGVGVTVLVSNLERSLAFYHDMLGFYEIDSGPDSAVLASGDTRLVLMAARESEPVHRRQVHLNLEVGDVDAVFGELKLRGVRFTYAPRVVNRGERLELVAAAFKDPDGHGIAITQWKARQE